VQPHTPATTTSVSTQATTPSTHLIRRMVDVAADLDRVQVRCESRMVAEHARVWAEGPP
jgi:hypothetical protein